MYRNTLSRNHHHASFTACLIIPKCNKYENVALYKVLKIWQCSHSSHAIWMHAYVALTQHFIKRLQWSGSRPWFVRTQLELFQSVQIVLVAKEQQLRLQVRFSCKIAPEKMTSLKEPTKFNHRIPAIQLIMNELAAALFTVEAKDSLGCATVTCICFSRFEFSGNTLHPLWTSPSRKIAWMNLINLRGFQVTGNIWEASELSCQVASTDIKGV